MIYCTYCKTNIRRGNTVNNQPYCDFECVAKAMDTTTGTESWCINLEVDYEKPVAERARTAFLRQAEFLSTVDDLVDELSKVKTSPATTEAPRDTFTASATGKGDQLEQVQFEQVPQTSQFDDSVRTDSKLRRIKLAAEVVSGRQGDNDLSATKVPAM